MSGWLDYNTWWVLFGTSLLGAACGAVGVFLLLRRRALVADVISHATLPGIAAAFWLLWASGQSGKSLAWLLLGAACSAGLGALTLLLLRNRTRLREDAAMGVVLTGWFAVGTVLLRWVQGLGGDAAGLEGFLFGKTATLVAEDGRWIALASLVSVGLVLLLKRPIGLICFDPAFATSLGWSVWWLDFGLMMAAMALIIVGLQAVGAILMVALLVIPPAAARFWTTRLHRLLMIAMGLGGSSGMVGAWISDQGDKIPSGPAIVLTGVAFFLISLLFGTHDGLARRWMRHRALEWIVRRDHFLRDFYEYLESRGKAPTIVGHARSADVPGAAAMQWTRGMASHRTLFSRLHREGLVIGEPQGSLFLTAKGIQQAIIAVRKHRFVEHYLHLLLDLPADAIDRGADATEHWLDETMLARLESQLGVSTMEVPESLHPIVPDDKSGTPPIQTVAKLGGTDG